MKIIEKLIFGKSKNQDLCEDIIFQSNDFVAIIDGATSKSAITFNGNSTGKQSALLIENALFTLPKDSTKENTAKHITNYIYNFYLTNNHLIKIEEAPLNKCTSSAIIYSNHLKEIWFFGDCQCLIDNKHYTDNKLIDEVAYRTRSIIVGSLLKKGHTIDSLLENDISRTSIMEILKNQQAYQNISLSESPYGYVCFDGFDIPTNDVKTIKVPNDAKTIVLASDGYPAIFPSLAESEKYLQHIKDVDPLCYKINPSTKGFQKELNSFDDRSFISFHI